MELLIPEAYTHSVPRPSPPSLNPKASTPKHPQPPPPYGRDACGECGGDGASCTGCDGELNSGAVHPQTPQPRPHFITRNSRIKLTGVCLNSLWRNYLIDTLCEIGLNAGDRPVRGVWRAGRSAVQYLSFFFITLGLEVSDTKVYVPSILQPRIGALLSKLGQRIQLNTAGVDLN